MAEWLYEDGDLEFGDGKAMESKYAFKVYAQYCLDVGRKSRGRSKFVESMESLDHVLIMRRQLL